MKRMFFVIFIFVSFFGLFAEGTNTNETNWILYDDWVTGPGSEENKNTYLLPFGYVTGTVNPANWTFQGLMHFDDKPLLYETDMGWPVPDKNESELKYLFFGDTKFFMRDDCGRIMSKITEENDDDALLDFNIDEDAVDDSDLNSHFESCDDDTETAEIAWESMFSSPIGSNLHTICRHYCLENSLGSDLQECSNWCFAFYAASEIRSGNYEECFSFCKNLNDDSVIFSYMNFDSNSKDERCRHFCMFDMVETYASRGYFLYDGNDNPVINGHNYNNGTSNIFLAANLYKDGSGNETRYNIKFSNIQPEGSNLNSAQVHSTTDNRRSKSIWMSSFERELEDNAGIYPRGYFYACEGVPDNSGNSCSQESKKLFVPYNFTSWNFFSPAVFGENLRKHLGLPDTAQFAIAGNDLDLDLNTELNESRLPKYDFNTEFNYLAQNLGVGIYNFEKECRINFARLPDEQFPSCSTSHLPFNSECVFKDYPNNLMLWPLFSKMSNVTVIHGLDRDILSPNDGKEYVYFMGIGETEIDTSLFYITRTKKPNDDKYIYKLHIKEGYNSEDIVKKTQKVYIARVQNYESEIMCPSSYEYFKGITNGIAKWTKDMDKAEPLYGFYPLQAMVAESIVKHRDLYWMTAPLNETRNSALEEDKKGFVILASPDALHWQKVDTILLENPENVLIDYAFFWLPPNLIESGDNTMPFLYSVWKSNITEDMYKFSTSGFFDENSDIKITLKSFLNDEGHQKFTHYNLKSGKYKFMEKNKTRAFLLNTPIYDNILTNTIPGKLPTSIYDHPFYIFYNDTIALPFTTFQNLNNLNFTDEIEGEREQLKKRYVIIEYCNCDNQKEAVCKGENGNCSPYKRFVTDNGNGEENWKIIDIVEDEFFEEYVSPCKNGNENIPDYMCNIPFEHGENLPKGIRSTPVWNWRDQITKDLEQTPFINSANVILRFSHWYGESFEQGNYGKINRQLMENNKLIPFECAKETDDGDEDDDEDNLIEKTCKSASSWRTTKMLHLNYKIPFYFFGHSDKLRLEYLYPYPVMIHDYGKPGDPAPDIWDMLTADHFAREFFKVSSFEYADSSLRTLTSGAAATAVIKNGVMRIYAWGGTVSLVPRSTSLAGILYVGTYNPETEVVTFMSEILDETDANSPALTAGASMVYDDENDKIYLIGAVDQNGISRIYSLEEDAQSGRKWESVTTIDLGRYFRLVKKSEHEYFAFGGQTGETSFNTKLYLLDLNNIASPQLIANIPTSGLANSFAAYSEMDQKLYIFGGQDSNGATDRFLSFDTKTAAWSEINAVGGPGAGFGGVILVDYITETISLGGGVFENAKDRQFKWIFNPKDMTWTKELKSGSYCLKETDSALQGGLGTSGECVPFTHPWYSSFSAGATVYSLSGKGDRLYVGTNNAIKVYDISDPIAPVLLSSFSTSSRVNDLEVDGDALFAATNGGLYKLDASNDTLTQTLFVSTTLNYQYKVEVYNGKLYVGDDSGIKVRDLETLSVLTSVNNGSVLDFAIENGEIGLYKDALFSPVEIRDADTLALKANEFFGCFEIEVGSSDGRFYLSCDDETYRFEDDGDGGVSFTELSGDIRELQDVYTYNGYTYFYDENTIWISTGSDVPALCGNGIGEGDEVCDGTPIDCTELDVSGHVSTNSGFVSGTATCNATCDGYNTNNCSDDGW